MVGQWGGAPGDAPILGAQRPDSLRAMHVRVTAAGLVLVAFISGCGASSTDSAKNLTGVQADVANVIGDLVDATAKRDSKKICNDLLSPGSVAAIRAKQGKPCVDALPDLITATSTRAIDVKKVVVNGDRATVAVSIPAGSEDQKATMTLRKFGNAWRIVLVGDK